MAQWKRTQVFNAAIMGEYPDWLTENLVMANKLKKNREEYLQRALRNLNLYPQDQVLINRVLDLQNQVGKVNRYLTDPIRYKNEWDTSLERLYRQAFRNELTEQLSFY